jgi:tripartite-type tricarboxylate transporter receptor subunit TctC
MNPRNSMTRRRAVTLLATSTVGTLVLPQLARAQEALDTVKVLLGVPAGSMIDQSARRMADALKKGYAVNTVVENRTGAAGIIAVSGGKSAAPDGRTVLVATSSSVTLYPLTYKALPYEPSKDLIPVSTLVNFDLGFAVGPMVPREVGNMKEYFAWCKANPTKANFGSPGSGSTPHFQGLMTARNGGVDVQHVAYRGPTAAVTDLVGGQVSGVMVPLSDLLEFAAAGKCRILAVTGDTRSRLAPNIPTFHEQGLGEYAMRPWIGVFLPAGTPAPIVQKLSATLKAALADKAFAASLETQGQEAQWSSPEELRARMAAERAKWAAAVKAINFTPES